MRSQAKAPSAGSTTCRAGGHARAALVSLMAALACALFATPAGAAAFPEHPFLPELAHTGPAPAVPCGVATDSAGNYYVADSSGTGATAKSISIYAPSGNLILSFSTLPFSTPGLCKLAVDSSGRIYAANQPRNTAIRLKPEGAGFPPTPGTTYALDTSLNGNGTLIAGNAGAASAVAVDPATQDVYVSSIAGGEVQEFTKPSEAYALRFNGEETTTPALGAASTCADVHTALQDKFGETNVEAADGTPATRCKITFKGTYANTDVGAVEVIKAGGNQGAFEIFKGSASPHISSFTSSGAPISNTIGSSISGANFIGVAVYGKNGNVYVTDKGVGHNKAFVLNHAGNAILAEFNGADSPAGAFDFSNVNSLPAIAVDQSNGHAYVSDIRAHGVIDEFDGAGNFVSQLARTPAFEEVSPGNGIAVDNGASSPGKGRIYFTARTEAGANRGVFAFGPLIYGFPLKVTKTGLGSGTVTSSPFGIECGASCEAEYESGATISLSAQANPGSVFAGWSGCDALNGDECEVTLEAAAEVSALFNSFPVISGGTASQITSSSARLEAIVNPKGKATSYRFEYLTQEAWEENGESFAGSNTPSKAPASPVAIGSGTANVAVMQKVSGLQAATAYRFRVVATSSVGTSEGTAQSFATYSPPEKFPPCANAAFRSRAGANLPDCRAYEQASPVDKNGLSLQGTANATIKAAPDGSAISFENPAGLPGGIGAQNFPTYVARRGAGSWSTTGLLPDPSVGLEAAVIGWTPDFSLAFDHAGSVAQGRGFYARSTTGQPLTELVPHTSPLPAYTYVGASADVSTVIFLARPLEEADATQKLTPDAAAGKPNVYAFDRDTGELNLVGVLPDGSTPPLGSRTGTNSTYNQDMRAVSEDGSVFFTDLNSEGQLYLRLNPTAEETTAKDADGNCVPDPVLACTVHISATQKENGKGPEGRDAAGPQPAVLRVATPDASTAIFTSSEKLTDDANTGPEPEAPSIAQAKLSDGTEKQIDFIPTFANEIAVAEDEGYVYWTDPSHNRIGRAKLDGTDVDESYVAVSGEPLGIAVIDEPTAEYLYWTDRGQLNANGKPQAGLGSIGRVKLDGTGVNPTCYTGLTNPRSITASDTYVYWTSPNASSTIGVGNIGRATIACEGAEGGTKDPSFKVETGASGDVAVDATHLYISLYLSDSHLGGIQRFTIDGEFAPCSGMTFSDASAAPSLAVSSEKIYWTDAAHERIGRSDLDCGNRQLEVIGGAGRAEDLAIASPKILWTANQKLAANPGNDLYSFDHEDGELTDLAVDSTNPNGVDVQGVLGASEDGSYVYFAANGVPDDLVGSPNANGEEATLGDCKGDTGLGASGTCNLYFAHSGEVTFIARLTAKSPDTGHANGDGLNWVGGRDSLPLGIDKSARVSADGKTLLFRSYRQLTAYDNQGPECAKGVSQLIPGACREFYLYQVGEPGLLCITCNPTGAAPTKPPELSSLGSPGPAGAAAQNPAAVLTANLSSDGKRVFFESPDQLVGTDTNGHDGCPRWGTDRQLNPACQDVYEWEAPGKGSCTESSNAYSPLNGGCIYLLSTGKGTDPSFLADASESGDDVFIFTYERLVPQDEDELLDVYDARVNGGLASQHQIAAVPCEGEACKGQASSGSSSGSPGTPSFQGAGNQSVKRGTPRPRCPKGKRKVRRKGKSRCVKRARNHKRAANANRRAGR